MSYFLYVPTIAHKFQGPPYVKLGLHQISTFCRIKLKHIGIFILAGMPPMSGMGNSDKSYVAFLVVMYPCILTFWIVKKTTLQKSMQNTALPWITNHNWRFISALSQLKCKIQPNLSVHYRSSAIIWFLEMYAWTPNWAEKIRLLLYK